MDCARSVCLRISHRIVPQILLLLAAASGASAQTTYHLHTEASSTAGLKQLKTAGPDVASVALQTANLKSTANGEKLIMEFDTQAGVPGVAGVIPTGSTLTFQLWMKKTANVGTLFPRAKVFLNNGSGTALCTATGTTAITTTLTKYTVTCNTTANVTLIAASRFYLWAGANMTAGSTTTNFMAELDIEGTLNGNFDSQVAIPNAMPPPTITTLTPNIGGVGQSVTIAGTNFGATQALGASVVKFFNNITATPTSWSATSIVAPVPSGASLGNGNVTVTVAGQVSNGVNFNVTPTPTITSLTPNSGPVNWSVTIAGTNFGASQGTNTVKFNGTTASPTSWGASSITVPVPAGATSGPVVVTVNGAASNGMSFSVTPPPSLTSATPSTGHISDSITIAGNNFLASQGSSTIKFNGTTATPTGWTNTSIVAPVPAGATTGNIVVTVSNQNSNGLSFNVIQPPTVTSATPGSGHIGDSVTIGGTNFGATKGTSTLKFSGITATTTAWSNTSITATVPAGATTGNITATVANQTSNGFSFTVIQPPALTSVTPGSGKVGDSVTVTGTNFGATQGTSTIKFNGTTATPTSWTSTSITAPVPSGATSGNVTVTVSGQTSTGLSFTVLLGVLSSVYHLHHEPSSTPGLLILKSAGPDTGGGSYVFQGPDLINSGPLSGVIQTFDTQPGDPGVSGLIPGGSNLSFVLWLLKTADFGVVFPQASIRLNGPSGLLLCQATGSDPGMPLTNLLNYPYGVSCQTSADVVLTPTDRLWVSVGYNMTQGPGNNSMSVQLYIEGTLNDFTDSAVVSPTLVTTLTVTRVSPAAAPVNSSVTVSGFGFGASQGTSTISFNGTPATPTAWTNTSVTVPVPAGATSGSIVVTVNGTPSNGVPFTVTPPPTLTSADPSAAHIGDSVTLVGNNFLSSQGSSTVTFHGTAATPTSWSNTSITVPVPVGATTGDIVVTVSSQASNALAFTVLQPMTIVGTISRVTGGTAIAGATVQAVQAGVIIGSATTAGNGTYSIPGFYPGTYDIRVFASGFSSELLQGIPATTPTTTVNVGLYVPGTVSGKVTQANGVTPIAGAAVTVYAGPVQKGSTNTNGTGDYSISALHPGSYTAQAASVGYTTSEQSVVVNEGATTTRNFSLTGAPSAPVLYAYDALGRLIQVTDPSGQSAIYRYDAVGNIIAIERPGTTGVAIGGFTPNSGVVGTVVTISGTGFSTTPNQNSLTFHGVSGTVSTSTATQIVATVPAGATTGTIGVTTPNGSATSSTPFTVLTTSGAPSISGFSPAMGVPGTALTVNGTNFDSVATNNNLTLNLSPAQVVSVSPTVIQSFIPPSATTGRVSVATPTGTAVTSNYLWVVPSPYVVADVESTGVFTLAAATPVAVTGANLMALRAFEGIEGHHAFVNVTDVTAGVTLNVYDPFGNLFATSFATVLDTPTLRRSGTYSLVFDPNGTGATSATLTVYDVPPDVSGTIVAGGAAVPLSIDIPGRNGVLTFTGTASQRVSLVISNGTMTGCTDVSIRKAAPDETVLGSNSCIGTSGFLDTVTLPSAGTYRVVVNPSNANIGSLTFTLNNVPADFSGTITVGGPPVTVTTVAGQNAALTFAGTAAQSVFVRFSNDTYDSNGFYASILKPDGSVLMAATWVGSNVSLAAQTLPVTGTYTIVIDPWSSAAGAVDVTLAVPAVAVVLVNGTAPPTVVTVAPNATVSVSVSGGPGNPTDWVALAPVGSDDFTYISWNYLNGTHTAPGTGLTSATLSFTMPATPGNYEFRFFANNGFTKLATSTTVTVQ